MRRINFHPIQNFWFSKGIMPPVGFHSVQNFNKIHSGIQELSSGMIGQPDVRTDGRTNGGTYLHTYEQTLIQCSPSGASSGRGTTKIVRLTEQPI